MKQNAQNPTRIIDRFSGLSHEYDKYRPTPPDDIYTVLVSLTKQARPGLVVDLGCGTGISTRPWAGLADRVVGIDPSHDMIEYARDNTAERNLSYQVGHGCSTGLADRTVDIVSCSTSIHWMEPEATFQEVTRILRPGGVFGAFGPQVPPLPIHDWEVAVAFNSFLSVVKKWDLALTDETRPQAWKWANILQHARTSAGFRYVDELCFDNMIEWDAHHFCEWLATFSYLNNLVKTGNAEVISEFDRFKSIIFERFGEEKTPFLFSYRLILGIT